MRLAEEPSGPTRRLLVFPRIPQAQQVEGRFLHFIAYLAMPNDDAANFARLKFFKFLTDARVFQETDQSCGQRLHGARCGVFADRGQEVIKPRKTRSERASFVNP